MSAILDVLDEKAPLPEADEDPAEGLARLKESYAPIFALGGEADHTAPARPARRVRSALKYTAAAALICGALLVGMIGAQASGWDIFGALAQWTRDTFHFVAAPQEEVSPYYEPFRQALEKAGLPGELAPAWYPPEAEASAPEVWSDDLGATAYLIFKKPDKGSFRVSVEFNVESKYTEYGTYEKDIANAESYTVHSKTFYIFDNIDGVVATWSDETCTMRITGDLSVAETKKIINSIGGPEHD